MRKNAPPTTPSTVEPAEPAIATEDLRDHAQACFNQQCWCWGQDIIRPEGNWLIEIGFERLPPPKRHEKCPSIYQLNSRDGFSITLRGFGVFYGRVDIGGVFVPRFAFNPYFTRCAVLETPLWTEEQLPEEECGSERALPQHRQLLQELSEWIHQYELEISNQLGLDYRRGTLTRWHNGGKGPLIPASQFADAWKALSQRIPVEYGDSTTHPKDLEKS